MPNLLSIAARGLSAQNQYIQTIAHNISNLNTTGFKAQHVSFEALETSSEVMGVRIHDIHTDFTQGTLKETGQSQDVAIDGEGFLQAMTDNGDLVYARTSHLSIDKDGFLSTPQGFRLQEAIQIPSYSSSIQVEKNGDIYALYPDKTPKEKIGTLQLARFLNPETLKTLTEGIYQPTEQTSNPIIENPGHNGLGLFVQNHVEASNVDMVSALTALTLAQRIYEMNAKVAKIANELEKINHDIPH